MTSKYDKIGLNYAHLRRPDVRIAQRIHNALGDAQNIINVGAGAGSYEPEKLQTTAVEPSAEMIAQRPKSNAHVIQGHAESLPFADNSFDAAMAVLTIHHWTDQEKGAREMRRVARDKVVFLTYDASFGGFWLLDYFPALGTLDDGQMPPMPIYSDWLGETEITPVPIPHDCSDGFLACYWRRPHAYLDERVRAAMSSFWAIGDISEGLKKLESDLASGAWEARYGDLMELNELDCGYRLVETV